MALLYCLMYVLPGQLYQENSSYIRVCKTSRYGFCRLLFLKRETRQGTLLVWDLAGNQGKFTKGLVKFTKYLTIFTKYML